MTQRYRGTCALWARHHHHNGPYDGGTVPRHSISSIGDTDTTERDTQHSANVEWAIKLGIDPSLLE